MVDMGALWHPFSDMGAIESGGEFVITRGEGVRVFDDAGRSYLDATAGLWFANVGHGRTELADAAAAQLRKIGHFSTFGNYTNDVTNALAERLANLAPVPGSKVFLTSGGSDSIDTAAKIARRYWVERGEPSRKIMVGRQKAYHGMHYAGTSLGGLAPNTDGYGVLVPETAHVAWDDADDLRASIERLGPDNVAGFFCEPVLGAGGVYPPPVGYLEAARKICADYEVLFVADEVITGYGRIGGAWFASTRFGLDPDMVISAKGLSSGYAPVGAVLVAPAVAEPFFRPGAGVWFRHGYTYSGHAMCAAVALANLELIEREGLLGEAARLETTLARTLSPLAEHDAVREVRCGTGALAAVQLEAPADAPMLVGLLREEGVATRAVGAGGIQISPAFVMTDAEVDELAAAIGRAVDRL
jgi:putrescine---pyruvate transaminase